MPPARARRPCSVAATANARMGARRAEATASNDLRGVGRTGATAAEVTERVRAAMED